MATTASVRVQNNFSSIATDPLRNFKFQVNIYHRPPGQKESLAVLGFTSIGGLSITTESIPYRQGGYNTTVHQIPGQTTFQPIVCQRGVLLGTNHAWNWMRELFSVVAGGGLGKPGNNFRSTADILVLDHPVTADSDGAKGGVATPVKLRVRVSNCWISSVNYSDLNAGDNAILVEQMTLVHEGFDVHWSNNKPGSNAPAF